MKMAFSISLVLMIVVQAMAAGNPLRRQGISQSQPNATTDPAPYAAPQPVQSQRSMKFTPLPPEVDLRILNGQIYNAAQSTNWTPLNMMPAYSGWTSGAYKLEVLDTLTNAIIVGCSFLPGTGLKPYKCLLRFDPASHIDPPVTGAPVDGQMRVFRARETVEYGPERIAVCDRGLPYTPENRRFLTNDTLGASFREAATAKEEAAKSAAEKKKTEMDAASLKLHQDLAAQGSAYGQFRMGERFRDGEGVPKDLVKAREMLSKAAAQGNAEAATALKTLP